VTTVANAVMEIPKLLPPQRICVPVIVLGASSSEAERVHFLEFGADDHIVKQFDGRELLARVHTAMRRSQDYCADVFAFGDVQVDFCKMEVRRHDAPVPLTAQEFKLVRFMIQHSERALSREELLNEVWGYQNYPTTRTVDNHILRLRQKLERHPSNPVHFLTVRCVGYKFVPHADERDERQEFVAKK
jgi:DNA-binding response OmpR family regulator